MKKILSVLLVVAMMMSFTVCAFAEEPAAQAETPIEAVPVLPGSESTGLQAAIDEAAKEGSDTVVMVQPDADAENKDYGGAVINGDDKNLTIEVKGEVVISDPSVGSAGTTTLGIQVLKESESLTIEGEGEGAKITFDGLSKEEDKQGEDGNVTMKRGIQEYTDLTLDNVTIDGTDLSNYEGKRENGVTTNTFNEDYLNTTISVCAGDLTIDNNAGVLAAEGDNAISVSLYETGGYTDVPTLTITSDAGTIQGTIEVNGDYKESTEVTAENAAKVTIEGGNFVNFLLKIGEAVAEFAKENIKISGGTFDSTKVENEGSSTYVFEDFLVESYVVVEQDGKFVVMTQADADALNKKDEIVAVIPAETVTYIPPVYEVPTGNATVEVNGEKVTVQLDSSVVSARVAPVAIADNAPAEVKVVVAHNALSAYVATAVEMVENLSKTLVVKDADDAVIDAGQYEVEFDGHSGITIKLSAELMQKLGAGTHVLTINLGGYEFEVTIVIE